MTILSLFNETRTTMQTWIEEARNSRFTRGKITAKFHKNGKRYESWNDSGACGIPDSENIVYASQGQGSN